MKMDSQKKIVIYNPKKHDSIKFKWKNREYYAFLDLEFESNGSRSNYDILSIGMVITDKNLNEVETYYSLVRPTTTVSQRVLDLTNLTLTELNQAPSWEEIVHELRLIFEKYPNTCVYHFGGDDRRAIKMCCRQCNIAQPFPKLRDFQADLENMKINKTKIFHQSPSLKYLAEKYIYEENKLNSYQTHHALDDAKLLHQVARHFNRELQFDDISQELLNYLKSYPHQIALFQQDEHGILVEYPKGNAFRVFYDNEIGYTLSEENYNALTSAQRKNLVRLLYLENTVLFFVENLLKSELLTHATLDELQSVFLNAYMLQEDFFTMESNEMIDYVEKMRTNPKALEKEAFEHAQNCLMEELYPWECFYI